MTNSGHNTCFVKVTVAVNRIAGQLTQLCTYLCSVRKKTTLPSGYEPITKKHVMHFIVYVFFSFMWATKIAQVKPFQSIPKRQCFIFNDVCPS